MNVPFSRRLSLGRTVLPSAAAWRFPTARAVAMRAEDGLKAAFLYNFLNYGEHESSADADPSAPLVIGVRAPCAGGGLRRTTSAAGEE